MGRIIQELEHALPGLSKAVFSQSIDKLSDEKVVVRPVSTKTGIAPIRPRAFAIIRPFTVTLPPTRFCAMPRRSLRGGTVRC